MTCTDVHTLVLSPRTAILSRHYSDTGLTSPFYVFMHAVGMIELSSLNVKANWSGML